MFLISLLENKDALVMISRFQMSWYETNLFIIFTIFLASLRSGTCLVEVWPIRISQHDVYAGNLGDLFMNREDLL